MSDRVKLKALAEAMKGWDHLTECWPAGESGPNWEIGSVTEDDDRSPVLTVDTAQWDQPADAEKLAQYYAAANPKTILALLAEIERLEGCEEVLRNLASYVGAGGYNATEVDPEVFARKIMDGINILNDPLAQLAEKRGAERDQLKAEVAALTPDFEEIERLCKALAWLGVAVPSGGEEKAARWVELVTSVVRAAEGSKMLRQDAEEIQALRKDAERYRYMRKHSCEFRSRLPNHEQVLESDYDAECDAAMAKEGC